MPDLEYTSTGTSEQVTDGTRLKGRLKGLSPEDIRAQVLACQREAEETYRSVRKVWDDCWDVAHNIHDASYDKKADWQAKVFIPEAGPAVRKATSLIRRILLRSDRFFDLDPGDDAAREYVDGQTEAIKYQIERMIGDKTKDDLSLITCLMEAVQSGFTFGLWVLKLWWAPRKRNRIELGQGGWSQASERSGGMSWEWPGLDKVTRQSSGLAGKVLDPRHFWFDPQHDFYIEETWSTLPEVIKLAEAGVYDMAQINKLKKMDYGTDEVEDERLESLGLHSHPNPYRKKVHLYEYWGDLYGREGDLVMENARVVVANKAIVLNPSNMGNPFWHGKPPYVVGGPVRALFRKEGRSLVEGVRGLQRAINNLVNMSLDGLLFKLLKPLWINPDAFRDPKQLEAWTPGQPIMVNHAGDPPMGEIPLSDLPGGAMQEGELLRRSFQNDTGVTDAIQAAHPLRPGTTATEASIMTAESNDQFEGYSREIEEQLIEPAIDMIRYLMIQYWRDFDDPALKTIADRHGLPWNVITDEERIQFLLGSVRVRARGISSWFEKRDRLKNLMEFLQIVGSVPPFLERLKLRNLLDRILINTGLPEVDKLVISEEEEAMMQQQQAMMASRQGSGQAQAPPQGPGPPSAGLGTGQQEIPGPSSAPPGQPGPPAEGLPLEAILAQLAQAPPEMQEELLNQLPPEYLQAIVEMMGPSAGLGTGPSTGLGTGPSTGLGTGPSTGLGTGGGAPPGGMA